MSSEKQDDIVDEINAYLARNAGATSASPFNAEDSERLRGMLSFADKWLEPGAKVDAKHPTGPQSHGDPFKGKVLAQPLVEPEYIKEARERGPPPLVVSGHGKKDKEVMSDATSSLGRGSDSGSETGRENVVPTPSASATADDTTDDNASNSSGKSSVTLVRQPAKVTEADHDDELDWDTHETSLEDAEKFQASRWARHEAGLREDVDVTRAAKFDHLTGFKNTTANTPKVDSKPAKFDDVPKQAPFQEEATDIYAGAPSHVVPKSKGKGKEKEKQASRRAEQIAKGKQALTSSLSLPSSASHSRTSSGSGLSALQRRAAAHKKTHRKKLEPPPQHKREHKRNFSQSEAKKEPEPEPEATASTSDINPNQTVLINASPKLLRQIHALQISTALTQAGHNLNNILWAEPGDNGTTRITPLQTLNSLQNTLALIGNRGTELGLSGDESINRLEEVTEDLEAMKMEDEDESGRFVDLDNDDDDDEERFANLDDDDFEDVDMDDIDDDDDADAV